MQKFIFAIVVLFVSVVSAQRLVDADRDDGTYSIGRNSNLVGGSRNSVAALLTKSSGWAGQNGRAGIGGDISIQVPNLLASGAQIVKQVPYVEMLKLVEAFIKLKGELAGRVWALIYDNSHIWAAVRDTLISKISTIHNLTLNAIVVLRKVLEFASSLFSNINVNLGAPGSLFGGDITFG